MKHNASPGTQYLSNQEKVLNSRNLINFLVARTFGSHGNQVGVVTKANIKDSPFNNTDGLVTNEKGVALVVTAGDCLPIYFYDNEKKVIGIAHAGWRGVLSNIVGEVIEKMTSSLFYCDPRDILVHIGPHIHSCHFTVRDDIIDQFSGYQDFVKKEKEGLYSVDLAGIVKSQLLAKKLFDRNISTNSACTFCAKDKYFSYRRDGRKPPEVMLAYIAMRG